MIIEMEGYEIELDEHIVNPGCRAEGMGGPWEYSHPAEGPEIEYTGARIIRKGHIREINPGKILDAIARRLGNDWEQDAVERMMRRQ